MTPAQRLRLHNLARMNDRAFRAAEAVEKQYPDVTIEIQPADNPADEREFRVGYVMDHVAGNYPDDDVVGCLSHQWSAEKMRREFAIQARKLTAEVEGRADPLARWTKND